jgi:hypothetical protein
VRAASASLPRGESPPRSKPQGGYLLIPAVRLALAWWAYREKLIRLVDLRVWFAACEMVARRCGRPAPLPRRFGLDELQRLTGLSPRRLKASLRRLEDAGLLTWSEAAIAFPAVAGGVPMPAAFRRFLDQIPNHRRLVPVPRRILRLLAGGARPALIATILGHLVRCLYLKGGKCLPVGRVKASWIADTFGVGLRRVKQARQELIRLGWLVPLESRQWALNRWGALVRINLDWSRLDGLAGGTRPAIDAPPAVEGAADPAALPPGPELAPPAAGFGPELAPPDSDQEPLTGAQNQEPALGGPAGFFIDHPEEETPKADTMAPPASGAGILPTAAILAISPAPAAPAAAQPSSPPQPSRPALGRPNLRDVVPEDLRDTGRLLDLYEQAAAAGLVGRSEHARLRFVAAAEHARVIGTRNPCGLFVRLVRGGLWPFLTCDDEEAASVRLRKHLFGEMPAGQSGRDRPEPSPARSPEPNLSADARLVAAVRAAAARARFRGDAFPLLKRAQPEWTRERWDKTLAELGC